MSKKVETPEVDGSSVNAEQTGTTIADKLKQEGTMTITAATRDDLFRQFDALKAELTDYTLATGAAGRSRDDGHYTLHIEIINKKG